MRTTSVLKTPVWRYYCSCLETVYDMESDNPACTGFVPDPCISYTNCTGSGFVKNWTESCCQPQAIRDTRVLYLIVIGCVGIVSTVCNVFTVFMFIYLYSFRERIKRNFNESFAGITEDLPHRPPELLWSLQLHHWPSFPLDCPL